MDHSRTTGRQLAAARALVGLSQNEVASAANISVPTLKRMEGSARAASGLANNVAAVVRVLEAAGVTFLSSGEMADGGPGVRLR